MRAVKVFVKFDNPIGRSMKQVTEIPDNTLLVKSEVEADLVVVDSMHELGANYNRAKWYVIVMVEGVKGTIPENVLVLKAPFELADYFIFINNISKQLREEVAPAEEIPEVALLPDAKKILVVEDTLKHQKSAKLLLAGHNLTVVTGFDDAMKILSDEKFEVVLSDLKLPMSPKTLSSEAFELGKLVDYGLLISLEAARCGVKFIAVATDLNHHADCFAAAFDHFSRHEFVINDARVRYMHAPMTQLDGEYSKDWKKVLDIITTTKGGSDE